MISFVEWRKRDVNSLALSCRLLDYGCLHINNMELCMSVFAANWVPQRGFHVDVKGVVRISPQISPVCNPAVERQMLRQFTDNDYLCKNAH